MNTPACVLASGDGNCHNVDGDHTVLVEGNADGSAEYRCRLCGAEFYESPSGEYTLGPDPAEFNVDDQRPHEPGDRVRDLVQVANPATAAGEAVVLDVHETRADQYVIEGLDATVAEVVTDWPITVADLPPGYDPDADHVVTIAFEETIETVIGGEWVTRPFEDLVCKCEAEGVPTYTYHAARLVPV